MGVVGRPRAEYLPLHDLLAAGAPVLYNALDAVLFADLDLVGAAAQKLMPARRMHRVNATGSPPGSEGGFCTKLLHGFNKCYIAPRR